MPLERLQKVLAHAGIASRRASERLIREGRVAVNGRIVTEMGVKVDPERDQILVNGEPIRPREPRYYIMLHKPAGYLSVMADPRGRPDLGDLVEAGVRLYPVGRLDMASEGLILLTNDGELANRLMHPRYEQPKTYLALVRGQPSPRALWKLRRGIHLEGERMAPAQVVAVQGWPRELVGDWWQENPTQEGATWVRLTLREGKKREVRRMLSAVGYPVLRLIRVGLGPLRLGRLPPGKYRHLTAYESRLLRRTVQSRCGSKRILQPSSHRPTSSRRNRRKR
ncbi:MAG: rRNA pseudouridine synthase [Anaerolineae bacterium]|nr:rRNA pseudouridine synthase [Anaerolineae bacterium]